MSSLQLAAGAHVAEALAGAGVDFVASLPDSRLAPVIKGIEEDARFVHVRLTREDEGVGVCAGAYLGGRRPCLLIQNSGLLECINDLVTVAMLSQIPMLLLVVYRGYLGEPHWYHATTGRVTESVIRALGIAQTVVDEAAGLAATVARAAMLAETSSHPVVVLMSLQALAGPP